MNDFKFPITRSKSVKEIHQDYLKLRELYPKSAGADRKILEIRGKILRRILDKVLPYQDILPIDNCLPLV